MKPDIQRAIEILDESYAVARHDNDGTDECAKELCFAIPLAISALEQQDKEPCEFCKPREDKGYNWLNPVTMDISGLEIGVHSKGTLRVRYYDRGTGCTFSAMDIVNINYCPMCGRRLTEV